MSTQEQQQEPESWFDKQVGLGIAIGVLLSVVVLSIAITAVALTPEVLPTRVRERLFRQPESNIVGVQPHHVDLIQRRVIEDLLRRLQAVNAETRPKNPRYQPKNAQSSDSQ